MNLLLLILISRLSTWNAFSSLPKIDLVTVPAGIYWVGCDSILDPGCPAAERPGRSLKIDSFKISKFEITQGEYGACVKAKKCSAPKENFDPQKMKDKPVVSVTWQQANDFCRWLGMQLPSELEWEISARGEDRRIYPWGNSKPNCKTSNSDYKCRRGLEKVGAFPEDKSFFGVQDLAGNAEEWILNWYSKDYWQQDISQMLSEGTQTPEKSVRGGSYNSDSWHSRLSHRFYASPKQASENRGFRCLKR